MADEAATGLGLKRFWAITPAIDLTKLLNRAIGSGKGQQEEGISAPSEGEESRKCRGGRLRLRRRL